MIEFSPIFHKIYLLKYHSNFFFIEDQKKAKPPRIFTLEFDSIEVYTDGTPRPTVSGVTGEGARAIHVHIHLHNLIRM